MDELGDGAWLVRESGTDNVIGRYDSSKDARNAAYGANKHEEVWSLTITPALKKQILEKGLPLAALAPFAVSGEEK